MTQSKEQNNDNLITIITTSQTSEIKGGMPTLKNLSNKEITVPTLFMNSVTNETLSLNLKRFLETFKPVFEEQETQIGSFDISEIELMLAINASGGIELIGKVDVDIKGGIKIKLQKRDRK